MIAANDPSACSASVGLATVGAEGGWCLHHFPEAIRDGEVDEAALLAAVRPLGVPSSRDGGIPVWPVYPRGPTKSTFSVRDGRAELHTDSQYHAQPERWVVLYCVRPARDGGDSLLLSGADAVAALRRHPEGAYVEALLREPVYRWHVPAVFHEAELLRSFPVLDGETIRWRRDNLIAPEPHARAADVFHEVIESCEAMVCQRLVPGDLLVLDNHRALHGRTHFDDAGRLLMRIRIW